MNAEKRKKKNEDLIKRMKAGETLSSFNAQASWFPPRPDIKKDAKIIKELFEEEKKAKRE